MLHRQRSAAQLLCSRHLPAVSLAVLAVVALAPSSASQAALSAIVSPAMGESLFYTSPWDWTVYSLIALVLAVTGSLASIVPAARATRVDPMDTLRYE